MKKIIDYKNRNSNILLNIPHSSLNLNNESFILNKHDLKKENYNITDLYTKELFPIKNFSYILANFSRLVVDIERFLTKESMEKYGMGAIYTKTINNKKLKIKNNILIYKYYYPYHKKLNELFKNKNLIIDCHSFPSVKRDYEPGNFKIRENDFCLGFNTKYGKKIAEIAKFFLEKKGYNVLFNEPFSGSIFPLNKKEAKNKTTLMIEINRRLYMNEKNFQKKQNFKKVKKDIENLLFYINKKISS